MPYPSELLPKIQYKGSIDIELLLGRHSQPWLLRKCRPISNINELEFKDLFPTTSDLFEFSTFIFGEFKLDHVKFKTFKSVYWEEGDECLTSDQIEFIEEKKSPVFLSITDCHKITVPLSKRDSRNQITETVYAIITVAHKPTSHNYWHFEFVITNEIGEIITREMAGGANWIKRSAKDFAEEYVMNLLNNSNQIEVNLDKDLYLLNTV